MSDCIFHNICNKDEGISSSIGGPINNVINTKGE